jgi:hypothetical protein
LVESVSSFRPFVNLDSPMLKYLNFLLPLLEPVVNHLQLSVSHLLVQSGYPCIPRLLIPSVFYIIGRDDNGLDSNDMGESYPALWRSALMSVDEG